MDDRLLLGLWRCTLPIPRAMWQEQVRGDADLGFMSVDHHRVRNYVVRELPFLVYPISGMALVMAGRGEHERAVVVQALAFRYPFVIHSRWSQDVFARHIDAITATLPPEVFAAARERGRARDLQATVKELLADLET